MILVASGAAAVAGALVSIWIAHKSQPLEDSPGLIFAAVFAAITIIVGFAAGYLVGAGL